MSSLDSALGYKLSRSSINRKPQSRDSAGSKFDKRCWSWGCKNVCLEVCIILYFRAWISDFIDSSTLPDTTRISNGKYNIGNYNGKFSGLSMCPFFWNTNTAKAEADDYLRNSGLAYATIQIGSFVENLWKCAKLSLFNFITFITPFHYSFYQLQNDKQGGYTISLPYDPSAIQAFSWIGQILGNTVLTLFKNYSIKPEDVLGKNFVCVNAQITHPQFCDFISQGNSCALSFQSPFTSECSTAIGKPVKFIQTSSAGRGKPADQMVRFSFQFSVKKSAWLTICLSQYACQAEYHGFYTHIPVPDPNLVKLGIEVKTFEDVAFKTILKEKFGN